MIRITRDLVFLKKFRIEIPRLLISIGNLQIFTNMIFQARIFRKMLGNVIASFVLKPIFKGDPEMHPAN